MKWRKFGQIFRPQSQHPKLRSHASNPLAIPLEGDIFRILYCGRDDQNRSSVGFVDMDIAQRKVLYAHPEPIFEHGDVFSFYSHGVSIGNSYDCDEHQFVVFMGWQNHIGEHWRGDIGRLAMRDKRNLVLDSDEPILRCDAEDPVSFSYPWIIRDQDLYRIWYGSTVCWDAGNGDMIHVIKYATSTDGLTWQKRGLAIPYEVGIAQAFSRPCVLVDRDGYHMWYSYRGGSGTRYRIGYAHSRDGHRWEIERTAAGLDVSDSGWDGEMIEYPHVFDHKGQRLMLYNGNGFGKTGFGLAILES